MNLFLIDLVDGDCDAIAQPHTEYLAAAQLPHEALTVVLRALGHGQAAQFDLISLEFEGHDGIVALLDHGSFHDQFNGCEALGTVRVLPISHAEEFFAVEAGKFDGSALAWLDFVCDAPLIEVFGLGFELVDRDDVSYEA